LIASKTFRVTDDLDATLLDVLEKKENTTRHGWRPSPRTAGHRAEDLIP
jgi:hypothetical protein